MGKLSGTLLILAGMTLAASALSSHPKTATDVAAPRTGGKVKPMAAPAAPDRPRGATPAAPAPEKATPPRPTLAGKLIPPPAVRLAEAPSRVPAGQYEPPDRPPLDRAGLTREIQRQLKRVGCYGGAVTGVWSPAVRRAMMAFTNRANATLPVDEPDQILLAMLRNQQGVACSRSCPPGEGMADGRCVPDALIAARAGKRPPPEPAAPAKAPAGGPTAAPPAAAVASAPEASPSRPDGRMSLAGPKTERPASATRHVGTKAVNARRPHTTGRARSARRARYAETRDRRRHRDYRATMVPPGFPAWAIPAFSP